MDLAILPLSSLQSASRPVPMPGDSFAVAGDRLFLVNYCTIDLPGRSANLDLWESFSSKGFGHQSHRSKGM